LPVEHLVFVIDIESGKVVHQFAGHTGTIRSVAFAAAGRHAASGSEDKTIRVWRLAD
jgi:WD40 repeat protein